ncbi:MAG: heparinase II/III family protein, partial [Alphaproteobacteria bacterium]|nr:heparinase II/III family protein [Alphaproteobacteria bacterium]
ARRKARELTADWLRREASWHRLSWQPDILGRRVFACLGSYDFFCASATDAFKALYLSGLGRQGRHLARALPAGVRGEPALAAVKGLIAAGLALKGHEKWAGQGLALLGPQIEGQVLADGGHVSRNPTLQLAVLQHLIDIRATLSAAGWDTPATLMSAIDRAAPFVRMLRHGDGGMALFNGSGEGLAWLVDMMLSQADARGRPPNSAPHSGFQRLIANRAVMLFDVGVPRDTDGRAGVHAGTHASTLSFELSIGKDRVIVNCGSLANGDEDWTEVERATAAHSTLIVEDTNSSPIGHGTRHPVAPVVAHNRNESVGNLWLSGTHDGYVARYGLRHRRRVYLASAGDDVRGEDALIMMPDARPRGGWMAHTFKVRFHLHPTVRAHKDADGNIVILRLPAGGTWRFRFDGGSVDIAEGIYLGAVGQAMQAAKQIVVSGVTGAADGNNIVANIRWSLQRIAVAQSVATDEMPVGSLQTGDRDHARVAEDLFS